MDLIHNLQQFPFTELQRRYLIRGTTILLLVVLLLWIHRLGLPEQECAGRLLVRALQQASTDSTHPLMSPPLYVAIEDAHKQPDISKAISSLQMAVLNRPSDAQLHYLLGRAYLLDGNPPAAIKALTTYTNLRPTSLYGHWELALAYEAVWRQWHDRLIADLILDLPLAEIEAPAQPGDIPFCAAEQSTGNCQVKVQEMSGLGEGASHSSLLIHSPMRIHYPLTLPKGYFPVFQAISRVTLDGANSGSDGVTFEVWTQSVSGGDPAQRFSQHLTPGQQAPVHVDLTPYAGQTITLTLATDPGPVDNNLRDLAEWVAPRVEDATASQYEAAARSAQTAMLREWQAAGLAADDLISRGEVARKLKSFEEALAWYERAVTLAPDWRSAYYYYRYLTFRDQGIEEEAIESLRHAISWDSGWINPNDQFQAWLAWGTWLLDEKRDEQAESVLQRVIVLNPAGENSMLLLSEAYRILGLTQWVQGKLDESLRNMQMAVALYDQSAWAHIHLGKVLFVAKPNQVERVKQEFSRALDLIPDDSRIWVNLIEFWQWQAQDQLAEEYCEQAIEKMGDNAELHAACSR
ncbi:MAG: tetratricopeptide repeat protein [Dehalococcoidia bacterium]|nr:tetratricopeptide repeat protein [Dehalococcoidia bacterium]